MKFPYLISIILLASSSQAWAYGSDSSSKACEKPKFSHFEPANNSTVVPHATFSFIASQQTLPDSLQVTVKGQPVELVITAKNQVFYVQGQLPDSLNNEFVRINIAADSTHKCRGADGWLLKIE